MFQTLFYIDWTYWVFVIPCLIISAICSANVNSTFSKYSKIQNSRGITGAQAAQRVLQSNGVTGVRVEMVSGHLSDHFDPRTNVIRLSESVYNSTTVAAVGVASHEAGHAVQHAQGYVPNKIRGAIVPIVNIGSRLGWILVLIGLFLPVEYTMVLNIGLILYSASTVFTLVSLPVEFNASSRAMRTIRETNLLSDSECKGAKRTLQAAAMTYVAAALTSIMQLLRLILIANRRNDR